MATINRVPQGLLPLLDAKTLGKTPGDTNPNLQSTLDLTPFYAADIPLITATATQVIGSGNIGTTTTTVEIPSGELWLVRGISGNVVVGTAGGDYTFELVVDTNTGLGAHWLTSADQYTATLNTFEQMIKAVNFTPWAMFGAGTIFGLWPTHLFPAVATSNTSILYHRLEV